jgi:hypothetical protein
MNRSYAPTKSAVPLSAIGPILADCDRRLWERPSFDRLKSGSPISKSHLAVGAGTVTAHPSLVHSMVRNSCRFSGERSLAVNSASHGGGSEVRVSVRPRSSGSWRLLAAATTRGLNGLHLRNAWNNLRSIAAAIASYPASFGCR